jgi:hypothetical protein
VEHQLCPRCRRHGRLLEAPPRYAYADYYRCDICGEVWIKFAADFVNASSDAVFTREHDVIRQWAEARHAEPATGEATPSGPHTVHVNDGGAGIRFNFPGAAAFRPISWEEWFQYFDQHHCVFVFDNNHSMPLSSTYRIVNADEWKHALS